MWLPKDERRLLAGYYTALADVGVEQVYEISDLAPFLKFNGHRQHVLTYGTPKSCSCNSGAFSLTQVKKEIPRVIETAKRLESANKLLLERELITFRPHQSVERVACIGLTLEGYDLGRRYACWLTRSGLWFQEYRNHWIWLILAFFGGALVSKLIDWIASLVTSAPDK